MKRLNEVEKILTDSEFTTKVYLYMATPTAGDDFDSYEKNYTYTNLNPLTLKAYVRELTAETSFYKQYGIQKGGIIEILCSNKYTTWFELARKIVIDGKEYETLKDNTGSRVGITKRPYKLIRVTLSRKE